MIDNNISAGLIQISTPVLCVCREFRGDYMKSSEYVSEVAEYLDQKGLPYPEKQIVGIYYDNPADTPEQDLRSWQGVLVGEYLEVEKPYFIYRIEGEYVSVKSKGDPAEIIGRAYETLFRYIHENDIRTQSREGIQIMRMTDNQFEIQLLMKVA